MWEAAAAAVFQYSGKYLCRRVVLCNPRIGPDESQAIGFVIAAWVSSGLADLLASVSHMCIGKKPFVICNSFGGRSGKPNYL